MTMRSGVLKTVIALLAICLGAYIVGPPLYWHLIAGLASTSASSCPLCNCECDSLPHLSIHQGLNNASFEDCAEHDPKMTDETRENSTVLLSAYLKLKETEALEKQRRADMGLLEAKKTTSQYLKEADKCNSGMETCEEGREKSETALLLQRQLTALWEQRARQKGWGEAAKAQPKRTC